MQTIRAGLIAACFLALPTVAEAGRSAPARACVATGQANPVSDLVLGHFRGGRVVVADYAPPTYLWADEYTCFTSMKACKAWQRDMNATYRDIEGDRTCMPLR
jgi:hypothetical protein